jgi:hypothetical protein
MQMMKLCSKKSMHTSLINPMFFLFCIYLVKIGLWIAPNRNDFQLEPDKTVFFIRLPGKKTAGEKEVWANLGAIMHLGSNFPLPLLAPRCDNLCYWPNFVFALSSAAIRKSLAMILARPRVHQPKGLVCGSEIRHRQQRLSLSVAAMLFASLLFILSVVSSTPGFPARRSENGGKSRVSLFRFVFFL